jgi:hypothetical protein
LLYSSTQASLNDYRCVGPAGYVIDLPLFLLWRVSVPYFFLWAGYLFSTNVPDGHNPLKPLRRSRRTPSHHLCNLDCSVFVCASTLAHASYPLGVRLALSIEGGRRGRLSRGPSQTPSHIELPYLPSVIPFVSGARACNGARGHLEPPRTEMRILLAGEPVYTHRCLRTHAGFSASRLSTYLGVHRGMLLCSECGFSNKSKYHLLLHYGL